MRELTTEVVHTVDDKEMTFRIRKMNVLDGSYLMKVMLEKLLPAVTGLREILTTPVKGSVEEITAVRTDQFIAMIPSVLKTLGKEDLFDLIKNCLQTVEVKLPAGWQPAMIGNDFGVEGLEYYVITCLTLCYEVIDFNTGSFFGGKSLSSLLSPQST